jgi:hypothetical protein
MNLQLGILVMKITGILEWNTSNIYKNLASKLYILNLAFSQIFVCIFVLQTYGEQLKQFTVFLKVMWRTLGILTTLISFSFFTVRSNDIKMLLNMPNHLFVNIKVEKKIWKLFKRDILQKMCIVLSIVLLSVIQLYMTKDYSDLSNTRNNFEQISNATLNNNKFENIFKLFLLGSIGQVLTVYFGVDFFGYIFNDCILYVHERTTEINKKIEIQHLFTSNVYKNCKYSVDKTEIRCKALHNNTSACCHVSYYF